MGSLIYIHVPKCGGSSFGAALRLRYFYSQATIDLSKSRQLQATHHPDAQGQDRILKEYEQRDAMLADLMEKGVRCIAAHARYHPQAHARHRDKSSFITLLRDPVERFISHYHYLQSHHPNPTRAQTLGAFAQTQDARRIASQYLFYFGRALPSDKPSAGIEAAKSALTKFALIGDLSRVDTFRRGLQRHIKFPLPMFHRNRNPAQKPALTRQLKDTIETLCAADREIYDFAQQLKTCV